MPEAETALIKYIFLDIIEFTKGRYVEAQSDILTALNTGIKDALKSSELSGDQTLLLPTGDGVCIALLDHNSFDIHLRVAIDIIARIFQYNDHLSDETREFDVRIGINQNVDNVVVDINGRKNVAGMGINIAQRIMDLADGNQIIVGQSVYDILRAREKYRNSFKKYSGSDKHGNKFPVYQFVADNCEGLNTTVPEIFKPHKAQKKKLTKLVAYYMAHAIENKNFLLTKKDTPTFENTSHVLFYLKANDSLCQSNANQYKTAIIKTHTSNGVIEEQYTYYDKQDFWVMAELSSVVRTRELQPFSSYFISNFCGPLLFVNEAGIQKLKDDWPSVWEEFDFPADMLSDS